ncbi:MAG TPA: hypothetical protein VIL72_01280, partial [Beijerinckiaceae bacterium]
AYWAQGKNWQYHAYPASATLAAALAACVAALAGPSLRAREFAALGALYTAAILWGASPPPRQAIAEMSRALAGVGRDLRVLSVVDNHAIVEPAVRAAGATSVHRLLNMWPVDYTLRAPPPADPETQRRREAVRRWGAETAQADVAADRADVIVVQRGPADYLPVLQDSPAAAAVLAGFRPVARVRRGVELEVWARAGRDGAGAGQTPFDGGPSVP